MSEGASSPGAAPSRSSELSPGILRRCAHFTCDRIARASYSRCLLHSLTIANGSSKTAAEGNAQSTSRDTGGAFASTATATAGVAAQAANEGDRPRAPNAVPGVLTANSDPAPAPTGDGDARAVSALTDLAVGVAAEVLWFDGKWYDCVVHTICSETKTGTLFFPSSSKGKYKTFSQKLDFQDLIEKGYLKPDRVFGELEVLARCAVARKTVGAGLMS